MFVGKMSQQSQVLSSLERVMVGDALMEEDDLWHFDRVVARDRKKISLKKMLERKMMSPIWGRVTHKIFA